MPSSATISFSEFFKFKPKKGIHVASRLCSVLSDDLLSPCSTSSDDCCHENMVPLLSAQELPPPGKIAYDLEECRQKVERIKLNNKRYDLGMKVSQTSEHVFLDDPLAEAKRGEEAEDGMPERLQWGNDGAGAVLPCCCCCCRFEDLDEPIAG